ncbi:uncharacterized protein LOC127265195 [Andrographis paniculata]|uniref:uncharacterized protein LOC127265195 n=1 Tax=Andrographis paniculata TaxID=175694 RepID=UPI0021E885FE|nr:uncharacterized protein LOC127265195 [Andrographis paniculata]
MEVTSQYYFSAPTSPHNLYHFYEGFAGDAASAAGGRPAEEKATDDDNGDDDFAFDVRKESEKLSLSADELFDGGVIKPLRPSPPPKLPPADGNDVVIGETAGNRSKGQLQKKWRLKDFFLFRSASEGRAAAGKDRLKQHSSTLGRRSSFSRVESAGRPISAHELYYTVNRSMSENLRKKTFLPYKQGIVGRLAFNPAVHSLANGFGFPRRYN